MDRDKATVFDIVSACRNIGRYLEHKTLDHLRQDDQLCDAVIRKLEIIGEATKRLSVSFRKAHPDVPWQQIAGMRDRLIHDYDDIDLEKVWGAAAIQTPDLLSYLEPLLSPDE